jgi:hypothetical protein
MRTPDKTYGSPFALVTFPKHGILWTQTPMS